jgi:glycyl-tRNA synthetase beta chain
MDLSKADLMSEMVYEFTELQGLMGSYYFKELYPQDNPIIAQAIKEQYAFNGEDISTPFSAVVNISMKLDTLIGMFSIGEIPTGSRDPFALRRAVNAIISIALKHNIPFDFSYFIGREDVKALYPQGKEYKKNIETFVIERLSGVYPDVNTSIIQAVVNREEGLNLLTMDDKIKQVNDITNSSDAKESFSLIKRLANILKDGYEGGLPNEELFGEYEQALYDKHFQIINELGTSLAVQFEIQKPLDDFFANVMVNDENEELRMNRKQLLSLIYEPFNYFADFKQITL